MLLKICPGEVCQLMIRHGWKLKKLGSANKNKVPRTQESIEIRIRDPDGKILFKWEPVKGNLKQGLYECLDFTQVKLGLNLDDVIEDPGKTVVKDKVQSINIGTKQALERIGSSLVKG